MTLKMDADTARRARVEEWADQQLLTPERVLILDTETTGLNTTGFDEIIEVCVMDATGKVLFESLCQPQDINRPEIGTDIHGITHDMLASAPSFPQVFVSLLEVLQRAKSILVYNVGYDRPMLAATARRYSLALPHTLPWGKCVLKQYAEWHGEYDERRGDFKWQKLSTACETLRIATTQTHRAFGDCSITLEVLRALASRHFQRIAEE